jgi:hypothetical protein
MMGMLLDLRDQTFGWLTVIDRAPKPEGIKARVSWWICKCRCGAEVTVRRDTLENGKRRKCGASCSYVDPRIRLVFTVTDRRGTLTEFAK